jgi:hypothetical protein
MFCNLSFMSFLKCVDLSTHVNSILPYVSWIFTNSQEKSFNCFVDVLYVLQHCIIM